MHDITKCFVECFLILKEHNYVRSARQFALELETYPQSINEILKGRREVTLDLLHKLCDKFPVSAQYLLNGKGAILEVKSIDPNIVSIEFLSSTQYDTYLNSLNKGSLNNGLSIITIPRSPLAVNAQMMAIELAESVQGVNIVNGNILYCVRVNFDSNMTALKLGAVYVIMHQHKITTGVYQGKSLQEKFKFSNDQGHFALSAEEIIEIWMPKFKLSKENIISYSRNEQLDKELEINSILRQQQKTIEHLNLSLDRYRSQVSL